MIGTWVGVVAMIAVLIWIMGIGKRRDIIDPEDDIETPIDETELESAERAVRNDPEAKAAADAVEDDDDDWGPGSGHSPLPGVM